MNLFIVENHNDFLCKKFRNSCIQINKNWRGCFPERNPVKLRWKSWNVACFSTLTMRLANGAFVLTPLTVLSVLSSTSIHISLRFFIMPLAKWLFTLSIFALRCGESLATLGLDAATVAAVRGHCQGQWPPPRQQQSESTCPSWPRHLCHRYLKHVDHWLGNNQDLWDRPRRRARRSSLHLHHLCRRRQRPPGDLCRASASRLHLSRWQRQRLHRRAMGRSLRPLQSLARAGWALTETIGGGSARPQAVPAPGWWELPRGSCRRLPSPPSRTPQCALANTPRAGGSGRLLNCARATNPARGFLEGIARASCVLDVVCWEDSSGKFRRRLLFCQTVLHPFVELWLVLPPILYQR